MRNEKGKKTAICARDLHHAVVYPRSLDHLAFSWVCSNPPCFGSRLVPVLKYLMKQFSYNKCLRCSLDKTEGNLSTSEGDPV